VNVQVPGVGPFSKSIVRELLLKTSPLFGAIDPSELPFDSREYSHDPCSLSKIVRSSQREEFLAQYNLKCGVTTTGLGALRSQVRFVPFAWPRHDDSMKDVSFVDVTGSIGLSSYAVGTEGLRFG